MSVAHFVALQLRHNPPFRCLRRDTELLGNQLRVLLRKVILALVKLPTVKV